MKPNITLEQQKKIYQHIFLEHENGKLILNDLRSTLCVNSDALANTGDPILDNHLREGLRLAYRYIESLLVN